MYLCVGILNHKMYIHSKPRNYKQAIGMVMYHDGPSLQSPGYQLKVKLLKLVKDHFVSYL